MLYRSEIIRGARGRDTLKFASTRLIFLMLLDAWERPGYCGLTDGSTASFGLLIFCESSTENSKNWLKV